MNKGVGSSNPSLPTKNKPAHLSGFYHFSPFGKKKNLLKKFELRTIRHTTEKPPFFMRLSFDIDNIICSMRSQL